MKTPLMIIYNRIAKSVANERDKWNCGMKNNFFEWEDFLHKFEIAFNTELEKELGDEYDLQKIYGNR